MYLDAYYKLQFLAQCVKNMGFSSDIYITVPEMRLCNGTTVTKIYPDSYGMSSGTDAYALVTTRAVFAQPAATMSPQATFGEAFYSNIIVGSGTTPATRSDYKVENEIVDGLACAAVTKHYSVEDGTIEFAKTMENISDSDITISEIGLSWGVGIEWRGIGSKHVLVYREVLPEPIVVAPGESFTVKIVHEFTVPA